MFVLIGMAGTVLFVESLGSTTHPEHAVHAEHAEHAANAGPGASGGPAAGSAAVPAHHHGDPGTAAFTRPAGIAATFAATSALCWLVSRRRRPARAGAPAGTEAVNRADGRAEPTVEADSTGDRVDR